jgi:FkbH-like protein
MLSRVAASRQHGRPQEAYPWLRQAIAAADNVVDRQAAAVELQRLRRQGPPPARRRTRVALAGSYTTSQLGRLLCLAAFEAGIDVELYESQFGQYSQDLLDRSSGLYAFRPEFVILAVHEGGLQLPEWSDDPEAAVNSELARWQQLWSCAATHAAARVIQHTAAIPTAQPFGHLAGRLGTRYAMAQQLNARMMREAPPGVAFVDCDQLAADFGKRAWFDQRYFYLTKQALAPDALWVLARQTAAVLVAALGLSRKCVVLDLDGTLWGGIIGEDGLAGIALGGGPAGEAHADFQSFLVSLKRKGLVLAVASKNNERDARLPFEKHPDMRLHLDDFAMFLANWNDKATNLRAIAAGLDLGLDSLVMVDDNPAERALIRELLPEVDVIELPPDPAGYVRALADYPWLETVALTDEDTHRTEQYRARREAAQLASAAGSLEEFHRGLQMAAWVGPFDDFHLPRVAQLLAKTNQFNLTGWRPGLAELQALMRDPDAIHLALRLRDRFADHGLVCVVIAHVEGDAAVIDTWAMSCRVIGRTVEAEILKHLCQIAAGRGCRRLRGRYVPSPRNQLVKDLYPSFGFGLLEDQSGATTWEYDLLRKGAVRSDVIAGWAEAEGQPAFGREPAVSVG